MTIEQIFKKYGIYTLADAASVLGIKSNTLLQRLEKNKYPYLRLGSGNRTFILVQLKNEDS